jgi:WD40 repeat protein
VPQLREAAMLPGHDGAVMCVQFSRSGDRIATACYDGSLRVFDANSGERLLRYETGGPMSSCSFAPNASRIYFESSGRRAQAIDFDAPLGVMELAYGETARAVAFGRDGVAFWTAGGDYQNQVCAFAADGSLLRAWSPLDNGSIGATDPVYAIALHPTASTLLVGTDSGAVATIDASSGATLRALTKVGGSVSALQWSRDGRRALAASRSAKVAIVFDTESGATIREIALQHDLRDAALSPDGLTIATAEADETTVRVWSVGDGSLVRTIAGHEKTVQCVRFHHDGMRILSCGDDGTARLWSHDGALLRRFDAGEPLRRCALSDDGSVLLATNATSRDAAAFVFDGATGALRTRQSLHRAQIRGLALSSDGTRALTCGVDPMARAWPTDPVRAALQSLPETAKQALPNHIR